MAMTRREIQQFEEKRREIEENTLKSTTESLLLLKETEQCGTAAAKELNRQGEQLKLIDEQLESINDTLIKSQKNINGLKSVFGGLKNLFGKKDTNGSEINQITQSDKTGLEKKIPTCNGAPQSNSYCTSSGTTQQQQKLSNGPSFDAKLNANMNEMSKSISMLKVLATDIGQELEVQNELIDGITKKTDQADLSIQNQNKQMKKILKN